MIPQVLSQNNHKIKAIRALGVQKQRKSSITNMSRTISGFIVGFKRTHDCAYRQKESASSVKEEALGDFISITWNSHSDMDFNITKIKQSRSLFQLPGLLNLRKIFIDLTNQ